MYSANVPISMIASSFSISSHVVSDVISESEYIILAQAFDWTKVMDSFDKVGFEKTKTKFNISSSVLAYIASRRGTLWVKESGKIKWTNEPTFIIDMWESENLTARKIASVLNVSTPVVERVLRSAGVEGLANKTDARVFRKPYRMNEHAFESINDEASAYWLGFLFADGSVEESNAVSIALNICDEEHIKKFAAWLDTDVRFTYRSRTNPSGSESKSVRIKVSSSKIKNNLIRLGCIPNKTYNMTFAPELKDDLVRHFIRGLIDGDGHVAVGYTSKSRPNSVKTTVNLAGHKVIIDYVHEQIKRRLGFSGRVAAMPNYFTCTYHAESAKSIIRWLYQDAEVFLDRKQKRYLDLIELEKERS